MKSAISSVCYAIAIGALCSPVAGAQPSATLQNPLIAGLQQPSGIVQQSPSIIPEPPNVAPPLGMPPPIGSGAVPLPEISGDKGAVPLVPTGQADQTTGSRFSTVPGDTYKAPILVQGSRRGQTLMQYTAKYPYPNVTHITIQGKDYQYINSDSPATANPNNTNKWIYGGLPTVQTLSRYLVILGVVVATILMAQASFGMVMGEENAGARVIHTAAGLMLLFMAFTIWKVVQANMASLNDQGPWDKNSGFPAHKIVLPDPAQMDHTPPPVNAPARSGIPVLPDSGN
jgi:hypothetical protein